MMLYDSITLRVRAISNGFVVSGMVSKGYSDADGAEMFADNLDTVKELVLSAIDTAEERAKDLDAKAERF